MKLLPLIALLLLLNNMTYAASSDTHYGAGRIGAMAAPEPFKSNWELCSGALTPDYQRDQPVGHENYRFAGLQYTMAAIEDLRKGNLGRAMFFASSRTHYLEDSACIAHADVWWPREPHRIVWNYLPAEFQDYWIPFGPIPEGKTYYPILIDEPEFMPDMWQAQTDRGHPGSMHGYFDQVHGLGGHRNGFPVDTIPDTTNWSAYDREIYARWEAECLALKVLDRKSVLAKKGKVKFVSADEMQDVLDEEMRSMTATVSTYYRYLTVASKTDVTGDIEELFPASDRLMLMAKREPHIYLAENAPWALKRAVYLFAFELVRAQKRREGVFGPQYMNGMREGMDALIKYVPFGEGETDKRVVIAWGSSEDRVADWTHDVRSGNHIDISRDVKGDGHIVLRGESLQDTIHLVDYLLDLTQAPLNSRTPVEVILTVIRKEWPGMQLIEDVRQTPDSEVTEKFRPLPLAHPDDMAEWEDKVHWMVWPNVDENGYNLSGVLPTFWDMFLLELPLPDGTVVDLK